MSIGRTSMTSTLRTMSGALTTTTIRAAKADAQSGTSVKSGSSVTGVLGAWIGWSQSYQLQREHLVGLERRRNPKNYQKLPHGWQGVASLHQTAAMQDVKCLKLFKGIVARRTFTSHSQRKEAVMPHTPDPIFLVTEEKPQCQVVWDRPRGSKKYSNMMFSNVEMYLT